MDFEHIRAKAEAESDYLNGKDGAIVRIGASADNPVLADVVNRLQQESTDSGVKAKVITAGSYGLYDLEPLVSIEKPGSRAVLYANVTVETTSELVKGYVSGDNPGTDCRDLPAFQLQSRIARSDTITSKACCLSLMGPTPPPQEHYCGYGNDDGNDNHH